LSTDNEDESEASVEPKSKRSRELSSSSPLSSPSETKVVKKMRTTHDHDDDDDTVKEGQDDKIPDYLLVSNQAFMNMIEKITNAVSSLSMDDLRQIAIWTHHITGLHIQKEIMSNCLLAGLGKLKESEPEFRHIDRRFWPKQVRTMFRGQSDAVGPIESESEHVACENFVRGRLKVNEEKTQRYQQQLMGKKAQLVGFTSKIEKEIDAFVRQHGFQTLQLKSKAKIALIQHDYELELIERRITHENPNAYQVKLKICIEFIFFSFFFFLSCVD
jgi:hypothetical protein